VAFENNDSLKLYYSIGEAAEILNVNTSLIRFWEKEFPILKPKKNKKGNRQFTKDDIENLKMIYHLVKERGFTLQGAKEKLKKGKGTTKKEVDIVDSLEKVKSFLLNLKKEL
jgi:DNA-binding transcriptional MerR regulator|tara:strand:- start:2475 stop:2810 length:336 start_codon:yes stop_codon:yes gene_type:complete